jgi:response regulator RpfG family c-di-GMP phosphodiesterase
MRFFPEAIDAARHHHEHWDGSGYPLGLQGEAIPLFARIIPVVESFHAMQRQRRYATAINREAAWGEITKLAGRYYDPQVVAAFEAVLQAQGFAVA